MNIKTKTLLWCGVIACPLFITISFIEGAMRADYSSIRFPLSSLAIGVTGWTQIVNFIVTGILLFIFSFGLRRIFNTSKTKFKGPLLISLVGIGLIVAGFCYTDPVYGYPTNLPLKVAQFTIRGHLHDGFSMFVFVCLPWACFVFRKNFIAMHEHSWATYSSITGFAMIATFIITSMGFKQLPFFVDYAGLFQRLCLIIGCTWITLLAIHLLRKN